jgi:hypothetical protein
MNTSSTQFIGWSAIIGGVISFIGFVSLLVFFVIGGPFGTINDFLAIPSGLLLLPLVWGLYRANAAGHPFPSAIALVVGVAGFLATMTGSILLLLSRIDFQQSLLFGIGGFGLIGLWVLIDSILGLAAGTIPRGISWLGVLLGITPTVALLAVFWADSVANSLTGMTGQAAGAFKMTPLMTIMLVMGFISYAGLPLWFIALGRLFVSGRVGLPTVAIVAL